MHDLEGLIAQWRKNLTAASKLPEDTLDELEGHLRETVDQFVRSGLSEEAAFQRAVSQLGPATGLVSEFAKLETSTWLPIKIATWFGVSAIAAAVVLLIAHADAPRTRILLVSHVLMVTLGYSATFLIGALGICFVGQRCVSDFPLLRLRSIVRATFILGGVALVLTIAGVVLGTVWARAEWGRYWSWDLKEIGAAAVIAWQLLFLLAHRLAHRTARGVLVMTVLGNVVVGLGWFGANRLGAMHPYGTPDWPLLCAGVLFNLALFLAGLAPAGWLRLRKM
jgi:hypothetical protein